jgi:hypothetical protein
VDTLLTTRQISDGNNSSNKLMAGLGLRARLSAVHGFVEDWIEMRSKLQRQLKMLESKELSEVNVDNNK